MDKPLLEVKGFFGQWLVCCSGAILFMEVYEREGYTLSHDSSLSTMKDLLLAGF